jgi:hypothetical protein
VPRGSIASRVNTGFSFSTKPRKAYVLQGQAMLDKIVPREESLAKRGVLTLIALGYSWSQ